MNEAVRVHRFATAANAMSLVRLPMAVLFVVFDSTPARVTLLALAALTDFLDGQIARRARTPSRWGDLIDPLADKGFIVVALVALAVAGDVAPHWLATLLMRDVAALIAGAIILLRRAPVRLQARQPGKLVTVLQLVALLAVVLWPPLLPPVAIVTAAASVWALLDYASYARKSLRRRPHGG